MEVSRIRSARRYYRFIWRGASQEHRVGDLTCPACNVRDGLTPRPVAHGRCGGLIHEEVREPDPVVQGPPWPPTTRRCDVCRERAPEPVCQVPIHVPGGATVAAA